MTSPFTSYNSNQRVVAIPVTPFLGGTSIAVFPSTTQIGLIGGLTAGTTVTTYLYYVDYNAATTAAASAAECISQWQFQTAAHAAVGAALIDYVGAVGFSGATCIATHCHFEPAFPLMVQRVVPATATEIAIQVVGFGNIGAPTIRVTIGYGVDTLNLAGGVPGGIGGSGMAAQSATNPNTF